MGDPLGVRKCGVIEYSNSFGRGERWEAKEKRAWAVMASMPTSDACLGCGEGEIHSGGQHTIIPREIQVSEMATLANGIDIDGSVGKQRAVGHSLTYPFEWHPLRSTSRQEKASRKGAKTM